MNDWKRITIAVVETEAEQANELLGEPAFDNINYEDEQGNKFSVASGLYKEEQIRHIIKNFENAVINEDPIQALKYLNLKPIEIDINA